MTYNEPEVVECDSAVNPIQSTNGKLSTLYPDFVNDRRRADTPSELTNRSHRARTEASPCHIVRAAIKEGTMNYTKPEIVPVGSATVEIHGIHKAGYFLETPSRPFDTVGAYEADE